MSTGTQSPRGLLPPHTAGHGADHHTGKVEVKDAVSNISPVTKKKTPDSLNPLIENRG